MSIRERLTKGIYKTLAEASKIKRNLEKDEGIAGRTLRNIKSSVRQAIDDGKKTHRTIINDGGYIAVARKIGRDISEVVKKEYNSLEEQICTDGELDEKKLKSFLKNKKNSIELCGRKAYDKLSTLVDKGVDSARRSYREFVPSQEELAGKYAGIGARTSGILLRDEYEACLNFSKKAEKAIPSRTRYKNQILQDIQDSASGNFEELRRFYFKGLEQVPSGHYNTEKLRILSNYVKK